MNQKEVGKIQLFISPLLKGLLLKPSNYSPAV